MRKFLMLIVAISLLIGLVACGGKSDETTNNDEELENETVEFTDDEKVNDDQVVVTINGTDIMGTEYNSIYMQTKVRMHRFRQDVSDLDLLKEQTLNILIDQELLSQDAERIGIEVSDEEVDKQFTDAKEEAGDDQFTTFLEQYQLTEEDFKDQVYFSILHDKYLESEIPKVEVTDEEVEKIYEELKKQNEEFPDFDEIADRLKLELTMQKEQEKLQEKINELRDEAEIEKMI